VNCGDPSNKTWIYSGTNYFTGNSLNYSTDLIDVVPSTGSIKFA
jgi:hypothetical protein